jgi:hypothetical protein
LTLSPEAVLTLVRAIYFDLKKSGRVWPSRVGWTRNDGLNPVGLEGIKAIVFEP